jgi:hypothetical protein
VNWGVLRQRNPALVSFVQELESLQGGRPELGERDCAVEIAIGCRDWLRHVEQGIASRALHRTADTETRVDLVAMPAVAALLAGVAVGIVAFAHHASRLPGHALGLAVDLDFRRDLIFVGG